MPSRAIFGAVVVVLFALGGCAGDQAPVLDGSVAFVDVNVFPMDREHILEHQTVVVRNGRIAEMGPSSEIEAPSSAQQIDGRGQFLIPGLVEMHTHPVSSQYLGAEVSERDVENILYLYVANGVTTIRRAHGNPAQFVVRDSIKSGQIIGPRMYLVSPDVRPRTDSGAVVTPETVAQLVRQYKADGYDAVKLTEDLTPEAYDAATSTAREIGIPSFGHVSDYVDLRHAMVSQKSIEHIDNYVEALVPEKDRPKQPGGPYGVGAIIDKVDESRIPELVTQTKDAGVWITGTMVLWQTLLYPDRPATEYMSERPDLEYMPPQIVKRWKQQVDDRLAASDPKTNRKVTAMREKVFKALYEGGARIMLGTDAPNTLNVPGFASHRELRKWVELGVRPYSALENATRKPAEYFGATDEFGTVAVGRRADLVLLKANPLLDLAGLRQRSGVMLNGRWISEEENQSRLAEIRSYYVGP